MDPLKELLIGFRKILTSWDLLSQIMQVLAGLPPKLPSTSMLQEALWQSSWCGKLKVAVASSPVILQVLFIIQEARQCWEYLRLATFLFCGSCSLIPASCDLDYTVIRAAGAQLPADMAGFYKAHPSLAPQATMCWVEV